MSKWITSCIVVPVAAGFLLAAVSLTGCEKPKPADDTEGDEVVVDETIIVEDDADAPTPAEPKPAEPNLDEPNLDEPNLDEPTPDEPTPDEPTPDEPKPDEPKPDEPTPDEPTPDEAKPEDTSALKKAELLVELPWEYNTPDGMCLLPNGEIIVAVPNVNSYLAQEDQSKQEVPPVLIKINKDGKVEKWYTPPNHPVTGKAFPFGICIDPEGKNFYIADLQWFADMKNPGNNSRVLRIPLDDKFNPAGDPVVVIDGLVVANAVVVRDGNLYVSDTLMVPGSDPLISGIFRMKLSEEGLKLTQPIEKDPHMIASIESKNLKVGFGADGLTFDSEGNLYCGNFADGLLHKIEFDDDGKVKSTTVFAKDEKMLCCDGIFYDKATDKIYVADSLANAVQIVDPKDGSVTTLAQDEENDGSGGRLDQPCEVLVRGKEVIVSNMDFPLPGGVNTKFDAPYTISVIKLD